ncbi:vWA domain-containing protein [Acaryochloris marina]|uniref:hypothetical protein n=1 Tax=Acaryochloris marina TaxID=155978 RepID=UPI0021C42317|nr:hypothetical protein [Acaryochloris marina]
MTTAIDTHLAEFLQGLFQQVRQAGLQLTLSQYEMLSRAMSGGFGLGGWEDLQRTCELVWVKPSSNYDLDNFRQAFDQYKQQYSLHKTVKVGGVMKIPPPTYKPSNLPQLPPRRFPDSQTTGDAKAPIAVKTVPNQLQRNSRGRQRFSTTPQALPMKLRDVQSHWQILRKTVRRGTQLELDLESTLQKIQREGFFSDIVLRPIQTQQANLVLLVDTTNSMIPLRLALKPWIAAIKTGSITPAKIFRSSSYPGDFLYPWEKPTQAIPLNQLLTRWHRDRTVVLIWSDAGAMSGIDDEQRVNGTHAFLKRLSTCVNQIIWLNPMPIHRWFNTSAQKIAQLPQVTMCTSSPEQLQSILKQPSKGYQ